MLVLIIKIIREFGMLYFLTYFEIFDMNDDFNLLKLDGNGFGKDLVFRVFEYLNFFNIDLVRVLVILIGFLNSVKRDFCLCINIVLEIDIMIYEFIIFLFVFIFFISFKIFLLYFFSIKGFFLFFFGNFDMFLDGLFFNVLR